MSRYYKRRSYSPKSVRKIVKSMWWKNGWATVAQQNRLGSATADPTQTTFQGMVFPVNSDYTISNSSVISGIKSVVSIGILTQSSAPATAYQRGGTRWLKNFALRWSLMDCTPHPTGGGVDIDCSFVLCIYKTTDVTRVDQFGAILNQTVPAVPIKKMFFDYHDTATGQGIITSNGGVPNQRWFELKASSITLKNQDLCFALYCIRNNSATPIVLLMDYNWQYKVKGTATQE